MKQLRLLVLPVPLLQLLVAMWGYGAGTSQQNWAYRATGWSYFYCWGISSILGLALLAASGHRPISRLGLFTLFVCIVLTILPLTVVF